MSTRSEYYLGGPVRTPAHVNTLVEFNYRCDNFNNVHKDKHVLFAGCSFTAGEGLEKEETWAYKTYKKLSQIYSMDGYYNVGASGLSIGETIDQVFKYIHNYGKPDTIFIFFPEPTRDLLYTYHSKDAIESYMYRLYFYLEQFCTEAKIKLISATWASDIRSIPNHILPDPKKKIFFPNSNRLRPSWGEQLNDMGINVLSNFKTFYQYDKEELVARVSEIHSKKEDKEYSLEARDNGAHPGTSFHDYWSEFMFRIYQNTIDL